METTGDFFTSIDQSKHLFDMGLNPETADMCWGIDDDTMKYNNNPYPLPWKDYTAKDYYIPVWSITALLKLMQPIFIGSEIFNWNMYPCFGGICIEYCEVESNEVLSRVKGANSTEAAYDMVCWLFENKHIN